jgi:hypothetical protein
MLIHPDAVVGDWLGYYDSLAGAGTFDRQNDFQIVTDHLHGRGTSNVAWRVVSSGNMVAFLLPLTA